MITLLLLALMSTQTEPAKPALPEAWHGEWSGKLKIHPFEGKEQQAEMALQIVPLRERTGYTWKIQYGEGKKAQVRDYELIPQERAGHFVIDEKNGLLIDAYLARETLHSQFQLGESLLSTRYELKDGILTFRLEAFTTKDARTSKLTRGDTEIRALRLQTVQIAELSKKK